MSSELPRCSAVIPNLPRVAEQRPKKALITVRVFSKSDIPLGTDFEGMCSAGLFSLSHFCFCLQLPSAIIPLTREPKSKKLHGEKNSGENPTSPVAKAKKPQGENFPVGHMKRACDSRGGTVVHAPLPHSTRLRPCPHRRGRRRPGRAHAPPLVAAGSPALSPWPSARSGRAESPRNARRVVKYSQDGTMQKTHDVGGEWQQRTSPSSCSLSLPMAKVIGRSAA